jgi:SAM-dependent methyltransferase
MKDYEGYFKYLKKRSKLGYLYRRYRLYPFICRHLKGRAIDVGCGIGDMVAYRPNTTGVDVNPSTVKYCREMGLDVVEMKPDQLPFDNDVFESAILDNVMEHIEAPEKLLAEINRVLVKKGKLVVGVPGKKGYSWDPDHKVFYDLKTLKEVMKMNGFIYEKHFYLPFRFSYFNDSLRQYCLYAIFNAK